jgi:hypothetical protein
LLSRFPFDHEDVMLGVVVLILIGVGMMVFAVLAGIAYRLFEVTGGL